MAQLVVAYKKQDEMVVNFLKKLVNLKDDKDDEIVGIEDGTLSIVPWEEKVWLDNKAAGRLNLKVLLLDGVKGCKELLPIIDQKYNNYGIIYGWAGKDALISIDEKVLNNKEKYESFLNELKEFQNIKSLEISNEVATKTDKAKKNLWMLAIPGLMEISTAALAIGHTQDKKLIRKQMMLFAIEHFYINNLNEFITE